MDPDLGRHVASLGHNKQQVSFHKVRALVNVWSSLACRLFDPKVVTWNNVYLLPKTPQTTETKMYNFNEKR